MSIQLFLETSADPGIARQLPHANDTQNETLHDLSREAKTPW